MLNFSNPTKSSFQQKYQFWLYFLVALVVLQIPLVSIPFKWLESYFHEISHGITAVISGGTIVQIQLFPNGAGLCTTRGGISFFISFMGYTGAMLWGMLIYAISMVHLRLAQLFSGLIIVLLTCSVIFWIRDLLSFVIVMVLLILFIAQFKLPKDKHLQTVLRLTGIMVLVNSLLSPLYLVDGRSLGDGDALAQLTFVPEIVWVVIWLLFGMAGVLVLSTSNKVKRFRS